MAITKIQQAALNAAVGDRDNLKRCVEECDRELVRLTKVREGYEKRLAEADALTAEVVSDVGEDPKTAVIRLKKGGTDLEVVSAETVAAEKAADEAALKAAEETLAAEKAAALASEKKARAEEKAAADAAAKKALDATKTG